jgi:hypothetical protein
MLATRKDEGEELEGKKFEKGCIDHAVVSHATEPTD